MIKGKKGNIFFGVTIGLFIYIMGILFIPFLTDDITTARGELNCTDTTISDGSKLICLQIDLVIPYLIWFFISLLLGFIAGSIK